MPVTVTKMEWMGEQYNIPVEDLIISGPVSSYVAMVSYNTGNSVWMTDNGGRLLTPFGDRITAGSLMTLSFGASSVAAPFQYAAFVFRPYYDDLVVQIVARLVDGSTPILGNFSVGVNSMTPLNIAASDPSSAMTELYFSSLYDWELDIWPFAGGFPVTASATPMAVMIA